MKSNLETPKALEKCAGSSRCVGKKGVSTQADRNRQVEIEVEGRYLGRELVEVSKTEETG